MRQHRARLTSVSGISILAIADRLIAKHAVNHNNRLYQTAPDKAIEYARAECGTAVDTMVQVNAKVNRNRTMLRLTSDESVEGTVR